MGHVRTVLIVINYFTWFIYHYVTYPAVHLSPVISAFPLQRASNTDIYIFCDVSQITSVASISAAGDLGVMMPRRHPCNRLVAWIINNKILKIDILYTYVYHLSDVTRAWKHRKSSAIILYVTACPCLHREDLEGVFGRRHWEENRNWSIPS